MEQSRKHLKITSIIILIFAGLTLVNLFVELFWGGMFDNVTIPDGSPENIVQITQIVLLVFTVICLLPQVYIGIKGLLIAKKPNSSKGHIVWAIILFVLVILSLISPISAIINKKDIWDNVNSIASIALEAVILFDYIRYARAVSRIN